MSDLETNQNADGIGDAPEEKRFIVRPPLKYGKKLYIGEFLAERFIQITAFISIAVILGIFYYVFQESAFAFYQHATQGEQTQSQNSTPNANLNPAKQESQESYSLDSKSESNSSGDLKPESYGSEELKPETYGSSDLKPETYGVEESVKEKPKKESKKKKESSNELKPETYGSSDLKPKTYGLDNSDSKASSNELKPETYGSEDNSSSKTENATQSEPTPALVSETVPDLSQPSTENTKEKAVTITKLLSPNDTIDGKAAYIWQPVGDTPKYNLFPLFIGALKVTLIGLFLAAPIAILAAIFTTSFAPRWVKEILKPAIEILAGFPSVVIGFFCLITLASVVQTLFNTTFRLNSFVGGIGMALAVIPIIYTVTEDALSAIPKYYKEASLALGASRWQTAFRVILPAATPGVFAAIILGFGRAFGETMIALMATGNASLVSADIFESVRTMSATIGAEMAEVEFHGVHYGILFLIGAILFVVTFSLNAIAEFYIRKRLLKKFQGQ